MDTSAWVTAIVAALAGLVAGSWVTAMIAWLPRTEPGRRLPPWRCPGCGTGFRPDDLIPVTGWRRLSGCCCPDEAVAGSSGPGSSGPGSSGPGSTVAGSTVPGSTVAGSTVPGLLTAAVFVVMAVRFGPSPVLPAFCFLGAVGVALAFIDASYQRLPDALTLLSYPVALVLLGAAALGVPDGGRRFVVALIGLAAAWLLFLIQALIYPAGIGWGDVKLSGVLGLYLGWLGVTALVAGLFLGYVLAAVVGLVLLATRRATRRSQIPFGPFLLAGTLIAIVLSARLG
jgi:leader peptidase (prepilin peptidase)/N-methyltransferase